MENLEKNTTGQETCSPNTTGQETCSPNTTGQETCSPRNFDILNGIDAFNRVHEFCSIAEEYQYSDPRRSAHNARLALELTVKIVYDFKHWVKPENASLWQLTTDERFVEFINSADIMRRIRYVRITGNNASHIEVDRQVKRRESFFTVLNLYYIVASILKGWNYIEEIPDFNNDLLPRVPELGEHIAQSPSSTNDQDACEAATEIVEAGVNPDANAAAVTVISPLSEAETRKLYIDLQLREAGWDVSESNGEITPGRAGVEIEVRGMPNGSGVGYADYVLWDDDGLPLAVVEAKRTSVEAAAGRTQAELYAECLKRKYHVEKVVIYYTNGYEVNVIDPLGYPSRRLMGFHSKDELRRMIAEHNRPDITNLTIKDRITNREYQKRAIRSVCDHFNSKHRRALLVMATGTGKTRVSVSLSDVLINNRWVKNVLFLADRIELVKQAKESYDKFLPDSTTGILMDRDVDLTSRVLFSTYQTMMGHLDRENKTFTIGRFDLVIIDEAHRSVFGKYGAIFEYFDSLLLGLTATPRDEVDRSTYELFGMEPGLPTDSYEYQEAVDDGYLVPFEAVIINSDVITIGIDPEQLTPQEREQLQRIYEYEAMLRGLGSEDGRPERQIEPSEIFSYIYNVNTVDQVLNTLMNEGLKIQDGAMLGKTIIFAYNHEHAVMIAERFNVLYPELGSDFCRVIDSRTPYSSSLIDRFKVPDNMPQIAVSVDMLDTGIDVEEVLNLVFFKPVRSHIKFWQMIGRGTRLCPDLFGPGQDKTGFRIFDIWHNFEYFRENPRGAEPVLSKSITQALFNLRLDIKFALQDARYQEDEIARQYHAEVVDHLHGQISELNRNRLDVRRNLARVDFFSVKDNLLALSMVDVDDIKHDITPLLVQRVSDIMAMRFDALMLKLELALVDESVNATRSQNTVIDILQKLATTKASHPLVAPKLPVINEALTTDFWENRSLDRLERVRTELRSLIQLLEENRDGRTFTINVNDVFTRDTETAAGSVRPPMTYRQRVMEYLKEHLGDDETLQKITRLEQLNEADMRRMEQIFWQELGTKEEYDEDTHGNPYRDNVAAFIRSLVGIDQELALQKYRELIHGAELTRRQEEYLRTIIRYVCRNGDIRLEILASQPPFNAINYQQLFRGQSQTLIAYVNMIINAIAA